MRLFLATTFLLSYVCGQGFEYDLIPVKLNPFTNEADTTLRITKPCPPEEGQPRGKRMADVDHEPNCFYHADATITPEGCDGYCKEGHKVCKELHGTTTKYTCIKKPVFTPLGKYDICDKFPDNFRGNGKPGPWFNTIGSNYGCSSDKCCLWFPPTRCANIPTIRYRFIPFTDSASGQEINDCNDQAVVEANAITAAEVWDGKQNGLESEVCIYQQTGETSDGEPEFSFVQETVVFSDCEPNDSYAAGCCKFTPV